MSWKPIIAAAAALALGGATCERVTGPLGPLTGRWRGPITIDTYNYIDLRQEGARIGGSLAVGAIMFRPTLLPVSGTAELPQVVLHWDEGYPFTANARLSANGDTLSGTMSAAGGNVVPFGPYVRVH